MESRNTKLMASLKNALSTCLTEDINEFYRDFLITEFFIPIEKELLQKLSSQTKDSNGYIRSSGESLPTISISKDGNQFIPIFDTEAAINEWTTRPIGFYTLPGHILVKSFSGNIGLVLNPDRISIDLGHFMIFNPEGVHEIRQFLEKIFIRISHKEGTLVKIGLPPRNPDKLLNALDSIHKKRSEIEKMTIHQTQYEDSEDLGLRLIVSTINTTAELKKQIEVVISLAAMGQLEDWKYLDIQVV